MTLSISPSALEGGLIGYLSGSMVLLAMGFVFGGPIAALTLACNPTGILLRIVMGMCCFGRDRGVQFKWARG